MINPHFSLIILFFLSAAMASEHQMIDTLGSSPKGQYVALEQYGYKDMNHSYYVRIQVMNVWTQEYVGKTFEVEMPASRRDDLARARNRARSLALEELIKFDIRG
jgi:predicted secreted protein